MNFFTLSSTLFATVCLAAETPDLGDKRDAPLNEEIDCLQNMIVKRHPEVLPPFLNATVVWEKDVAKAFAIGQVLGKLCDVQNDVSNSSNSSSLGMSQNCIMPKFGFFGGYDNIWEFEVKMSSFQSVISANLKWKDFGCQSYNPFDELFANLKEIQTPENYNINNGFTFSVNIRSVFAKHAKSETAMIAIDVAILRWVVQAIKTKPQHVPFLRLPKDVVLAVCSLSMHPTLEGRCQDDILTVLTHLQHTTDPAHNPYLSVEYYRPSLITLFKFLNFGPVRDKVKEILTNVCSDGEHDYVNSKMLLGAGHDFVKQLEVNILESDLDTYGQQFLEQEQFGRKLYSMITPVKCDYTRGRSFVSFCIKTFLSAHIGLNGVLEWGNPISWEEQNAITINNQFDDRPFLIFCSQLKVPEALWKEIISCKNLTMFQEALKDPKIIRMIFTYGLTILENKSNIEY